MSRLEGIIPALETAHAFAYVRRMAGRWPADALVLVCLSGRGDKDVAHVAEPARGARVTSGPVPTDILPASQVAELINGLVKALRAYHMYLPNNPIYQRASDNLRIAFQPIWAVLDELVLTVAETDFVWEEQVVYHQLNKAESIAWGLFKDGMRSLTIRRGAELEELPRFLETINRARFLPTDAGDDLLTLLWEQEFEFIQYKFIEFFGDTGAGLPEQTGSYAASGQEAEAAARDRRAAAAQEAPPRPKGVVDLEEFDSTLYFLEEKEINQVAAAVEDEYRRDVRMAALNILFDLFETQAEEATRGEILGTLESLFPNLLNARDFRTAATILRECRVLSQRASGLAPAQAARLDGFVAKLSEPAIVSQLVQSIDEVPALAGEPTVGEVLGELRATALEPILTWIPKLASPALRKVLEEVADRLAEAHPAEVLRILRSPESEALAAVVALCGRLQLTQTVPGLGETVAHKDAAVRLASVQALAQLGTPAALAFIEKALEDDDRAVRLAAIRVVGGRGYKGAQQRVEGIVLGKAVKEMDLTEKMAFFEAYGVHRGRGGPQADERDAAAARPAPDEGGLGDPRLRRDRAREDPDARGARGPPAGRRRQGSRGAERREPRAAGDRRMTTPAEHDGERRVGGPPPPGRAGAPARALHGAPEPQALPGGERDGPEGARRPRHRRARAGGPRGRPGDPPGGRLHLRELHPPPARARQLRVVQPDPGDAAGVLGRRAAGARVGQPARVADLPEPAAEPVRAGRPRRALRGAVRAPGVGRGPGPRGRARRASRSTIPTPSRPRSRPSGSTRRAWRSPRT